MNQSILTAVGRAKLMNATPEQQLLIAQIAVGDGDGRYQVLDENMTSLVREVWRGPASAPVRDTANPSLLLFSVSLPADAGDFFVREIAIFDAAGDMIGIGQTHAVQQVAATPGNPGAGVTAQFAVQLQNAGQVELVYTANPLDLEARVQALGARTEFIVKELTAADGGSAVGGFSTYAAFDAYRGAATRVQLKGVGIEGFWRKTESPAVPDGGTVRSINGETWEREGYAGVGRVSWFNNNIDAATSAKLIKLGSSEYYAADVQLNGQSIVGVGYDSKLKAAAGANTVLKLGGTISTSHWRRKFLRDIQIDGNSRASNGVTYTQSSDAAFAGRWDLLNVAFKDCSKAIEKTAGNIGNSNRNLYVASCDFGFYAKSSASPLMHAGCETFSDSHFELCEKAAFYLDSPAVGTGGFALRDVIAEGNPGFAVFVKNYGTAYTPLILDNFWTESNATAANVEIDGIEYEPADVRLENVPAAKINGCNISKYQLISTKALLDSCFFDSQTKLSVDADSVINIVNAQVDDGSHPYVFNSLISSRRPLGSQAASFQSPARQQLGIVRTSRVTAVTFTEAVTTTGTSSISTSVAPGGNTFENYGELLIPAGNTLLFGLVDLRVGYWYVMTIDVRGGVNAKDVDIQWINYTSGAGDIHKAVSNYSQWNTLSVVGLCVSAGNVALRMLNAGAESAMLHLGAYQVHEFGTEQQAIDFYNSGLFA